MKSRRNWRNINKVFLIGRLTRDPELRTTNSGVPVVSFTVAVNRTFTSNSGEREAEFINCIAFNKQAENLNRYIRKGGLVGVEGRIQTRSYTGQDGSRRYVTEVVADNVEFLGSKNSSSNSNNMSVPASNNAGPTPYDFGSAPEPKGTDVDSNPFADFGNSIEISDDELPF